MQEETKPKIIEIPATVKTEKKSNGKRRVAAYARVSSLSDEQDKSFAAQIDFYSKYIKQRKDWKFVKVYYDDGISGLSSRQRDGFNNMIKDALNGKIDLIITKSLSRFARNTVDALVNIRKLKAAGVEVFFEKENIYTMDESGEFLITLMSSIAQEESRSISENITWGKRKQFADGKYHVPYSSFLGYDRGGKSCLKVNADEAKIVKLIYRQFLLGETETSIAKYLNRLGIKTPAGKSNWSPSTIRSILSNEKYKGDALLQKKFTVDFMTRRKKLNKGELPQYYVEGGHEAIVSPEVFALAQTEKTRRRPLNNSYSCTSALSSRIICGSCGAFYGRVITHSNEKYRSEIWRCNDYYDGNAHSPVIKSKVLEEMYQGAVEWLISKHTCVLDDCRRLLVSAGISADIEIGTVADDEILLRSIIEKIVIDADGVPTFHFKNGDCYTYLKKEKIRTQV